LEKQQKGKGMAIYKSPSRKNFPHYGKKQKGKAMAIYTLSHNPKTPNPRP
jgi:hypothetical protein